MGTGLLKNVAAVDMFIMGHGTKKCQWEKPTKNGILKGTANQACCIRRNACVASSVPSTLRTYSSAASHKARRVAIEKERRMDG